MPSSGALEPIPQPPLARSAGEGPGVRVAQIATGLFDRFRQLLALTPTLSQKKRELWDRLYVHCTKSRATIIAKKKSSRKDDQLGHTLFTGLSLSNGACPRNSVSCGTLKTYFARLSLHGNGAAVTPPNRPPEDGSRGRFGH